MVNRQRSFNFRSFISSGFGAQFLNRLQELADLVTARTGTVIVYVPGSGNVGVGGDDVEPPGEQELQPAILTVETALPILAGRFVHYKGSSISYADAQDSTLPATHFVFRRTGNTLLLTRGIDVADISITGGNDNSGELYLATNGQATRDRSVIVTPQGRAQTGYEVFQSLGSWYALSGSAPAGFTKGTVSIQPFRRVT